MKKMIALILALLTAFSLCACGNGAKAQTTDAARSENGYYEPTAEDYDNGAYFYADEEAAYGLSAMEEPKAAPGSGETPEERPGKIIYSANVQVETTDFDGSLQKLEELVKEYKGWVESSSVNGSNYSDRSRGNVSRRSASYTLRIPSDRFDQLMSGLSALGNVPFTHTYTENVTAQYYDVQARLTAYTAQETRLLEMMELAETVEDVIILEDRLTEVRYQIESLQSSLNNWDRRVSYSTVYLDLNEVQEYTPEPQVKPGFFQKLWSSVKLGLSNAGAFLEGLLFLVVETLPSLLILAAFVLLIVWIVRKILKKRRAKKIPAAQKETSEKS